MFIFINTSVSINHTCTTHSAFYCTLSSTYSACVYHKVTVLTHSLSITDGQQILNSKLLAGSKCCLNTKHNSQKTSTKEHTLGGSPTTVIVFHTQPVVELVALFLYNINCSPDSCSATIEQPFFFFFVSPSIAGWVTNSLHCEDQ